MATGQNGVFMFGGYHMEKQHSMSDLYLLLVDSSSVDFAPKRSDCRPTFLSFATVHSILMALGWGFFLQWGAFIARYFKHKEPLWLHLHRLFQVFGLIVVIGGFVCAILSVQFDHFKFTHAILGVVVMVLGLQQPLNALCRPHKTKDQDDKKLSRALWEIYHVTSGRLALLGGLVNASLGLLLIGSHKLVLWLWCGYVGLLVLAYLLAELRKRLASRQLTTASGVTRPDTYRANKHQNGSRAVRGYDNPALNVSDKL